MQPPSQPTPRPSPPAAAFTAAPPTFGAAAVAFATDIDTVALVTAAASTAAAYAADAHAAVWIEIRLDASALQELGVYGLADLRLWSNGRPDWAKGAWEDVKAALQG